jgi:hypothetical protein
MFSETFYVFVVASASALLGILFKICYDSKCTEIDFCCLKIKRDTAGEISEDKFKIEHNILPREIQLPNYRDPENNI